ncbi:hypothetical protein [Alteribacter aurantiacus]|uniref:hypothetical protein n=1 Tax=Alteribacter aurantiacus TaxID=254410 RepID=UPI0004254DA9|nr:hypothetical protein [Alteribacter aurantiacus]
MELVFVGATFVFIVGFLVVFSKLMNPVTRGEVGREDFKKLQTKFFIQVAILEAPIIIAIVFVLFNADGQALSGVTLPIILIVTMALIGMVITFMIARGAWESENGRAFKQPIQTFLYIGFSLVNAIPIICAVLLLSLSGNIS